MASKLPAVKVGGLKKKSALRPKCFQVRSARVRLRPGSNHSQTLSNSNFAVLWHTDPKFTALKDLKTCQTVSNVQEASSILRVCFALSKWPHFNSADLLRVPFSSGIAVQWFLQADCFEKQWVHIHLLLTFQNILQTVVRVDFLSFFIFPRLIF